MLRSPYLTGRDFGGRCGLDASWSWPRILAANGRYASPERPFRIAAHEEVAEGSGTVAAGGAALVVNVLVGEGVGGAVVGGAVVANVVIGTGGLGVFDLAGAADRALGLVRGGVGFSLASGAAADVEADATPPASGLPGGRLQVRFERPPRLVPRLLRLQVVVLAEAP